MVWMNAQHMRRFGPPGMVMDAAGVSHSNAIISEYLAHADEGRAWYLRAGGSAYSRRWHAKCRTHSDFAVVRHKSRAEGWQCPCGDEHETAQHVYLRCPLHDAHRPPLAAAAGALCVAAAAEGEDLNASAAMEWVHTDLPGLISTEALAAGRSLREAAMSFYARAQTQRYGLMAAGRANCSHCHTSPFPVVAPHPKGQHTH